MDSSAEVLRGLLCSQKVNSLPLGQEMRECCGRLSAALTPPIMCCLHTSPKKVWYGLTAAVTIAIGIESKV